MKYYTLGILFLLISLVTILISFYYINLTRSYERRIQSTEFNIDFLRDKIKINELEYFAHLNTDYLEKLEKIYLFDNYF